MVISGVEKNTIGKWLRFFLEDFTQSYIYWDLTLLWLINGRLAPNGIWRQCPSKWIRVEDVTLSLLLLSCIHLGSNTPSRFYIANFLFPMFIRRRSKYPGIEQKQIWLANLPMSAREEWKIHGSPSQTRSNTPLCSQVSHTYDPQPRNAPWRNCSWWTRNNRTSTSPLSVPEAGGWTHILTIQGKYLVILY